ncbi:MAG: FtsX-like permease family protein [Clostridia bacterium]|nr:FtsX-like permease family protein [Clostridia bacterium]
MKINKVLITDALRTVKKSRSRFLSIIAIVALGVSFFAGINAAAPDMKDTIGEYILSSNAMDIQIISTAGLTENDVSVISTINGVEYVEGEKFVDGVCLVDGKKISDIDGSEMTLRVYPIDGNKAIANENGQNDPTYLNRPQLIEGSWPTSPNQCLVDSSRLSTPEEFKIGATITVEGDGTDVASSLQNTQYTVVGIIRTPRYISYERGNTTIGTGKLGTFILVPQENFIAEYFSAVNIKLLGSENYDPFSDEYFEFVKPYKDYLSSISEELLGKRVSSIKSKYTADVLQGEIDYATAKAKVETELANAKAQVDQVLELSKNGDQMLADYKAQYNAAAAEYSGKIDAGKLEHSTQYAEWERKRAEYNQAKAMVKQYEGAETQYNNAVTEFNIAKNQVNTMASTVDYLSDLVAATRSALDHFNETQDGGVNSIVDRFQQSGLVGPEADEIVKAFKTMTAVGTAEEMAAYMEPQLQSIEAKLAASKAELSAAQTTLAEKEAELKEAEQLIQKMKVVEAELEVAQVQLDEAEKLLNDAGYDIQFGELEVLAQLSDKKNEIANFETNLRIAKEKARTIEAEYEAARDEAYSQLQKARNELDAAKSFLLGLDTAKWYVNDRNDSLLGFESYNQMADRMKALTAAFPWFFFIVAALVCLNTMTRMIEEERIMLGTFTALGFTRVEIMAKYLIYAFLAAAIGGVFGSIVGFIVFPSAVAYACDILFDVPQIILTYRWPYAITGIFCSIAVTVLATYYTCYKSLNVLPASLMRSKAPVSGKRVLLEKVPAIWTRLSFTWKVTMRNVFRNMKRFVMATMGVAGCTALLVAAFGLNDSINTTLDKQFMDDDRVWSYDMQIVLGSSYDTALGTVTPFETVKSKAQIKTAMLEHMKVYNATADGKEEKLETYVVVPAEPGEVSNYINLVDAKTGNPQYLTDSGAVITQKLAKEMDVGIGGQIKIEIDDQHSVYVPVAAIVENYTFHYIYMSPVVYKYVFGVNPAYNYIVANLALENMDAAQKNALAEELMDVYDISAIAYTSQIQSSMQNILDSISMVVVIMIVCAGLLAFIVLYNLSIINITERLKEIATIKVLGFDDGEVSAYIFRENILLTVIGIVEGIISGIVVHRIVLMMADVDIITYGRNIDFSSFIYSVVLAFGFSMLVNIVLHSKLKKVEMVESLKSIE